MRHNKEVARSLCRIYNHGVKTIIEPFRIKSVEPLHHTTAAERKHYLVAARMWWRKDALGALRTMRSS